MAEERRQRERNREHGWQDDDQHRYGEQSWRREDDYGRGGESWGRGREEWGRGGEQQGWRGRDEWQRGSQGGFGGYSGGGFGGGYQGGGYGGQQDWRDRNRSRDFGAGNYGYEQGGYGGGQDYGSRGSWQGSGQGYRGSDTGYGSSFGYGSSGYGSSRDRGFIDRASDEVSSWFGDREAEHRREMDRARDQQGQPWGQGHHAGRGPKNYTRSDERIREDVCDRLSDDPRVDASEIDVKVQNCEVTLSGTVHSRDERRRAEECAERVSGVRHVQNNTRVHQHDQHHQSATSMSGSSTGTSGTMGSSGSTSSSSGTFGTTKPSATGSTGTGTQQTK